MRPCRLYWINWYVNRSVCVCVCDCDLGVGTRWSNARWPHRPHVLASNIIGIGYNGASHIDEVDFSRGCATLAIQYVSVLSFIAQLQVTFIVSENKVWT